ncbi:hypothetical protein F8388_016283 [Cannabis sativa]|uniref:Tify domain-containing protein n=1 Tax=Cannabis sativa TaxID=3483 RepID=A0A7J6DVT6_CANSA|nr:hypothetical protein F8388_016283 [Cannabis sativa]
MRRNCNLELQLVPAAFSVADLNSNYPIHNSMKIEDDDDGYSNKNSNMMMNNRSSTTNQNQPLTIFYNGKICVCDVTEFQIIKNEIDLREFWARAIILLASREMEERLKTPRGAAAAAIATTPMSEPCSPSIQSPIYSPTAALSMKRSLQRFLQKRKHRAQATSPYYHH